MREKKFRNEYNGRSEKKNLCFGSCSAKRENINKKKFSDEENVLLRPRERAVTLPRVARALARNK